MYNTSGDPPTVLALNLAVLLTFYVLCNLLRPDRAVDRILFGGLTGLLLLNYGSWRWFDTLPPFEIAAGPLWSYLFFALEAVALTYTLMSIVILFRAKDRSAEADVAQDRHEAAGDWPAVDIFICTYNEPLEVVEKSILPALAIDYGPKTVWVLDDTRRPWLREFCREVGANYITRPDNKGAKAGNLNNGLQFTAGATNAPLILVLDADFAPQPDILKRMVGLFDDPRAAVVQSPQFFFNADPIQHNLGASTSWVDDQRIFFDVFQPAKDAWGCAFCVGTSFIVRRDRLAEIGGFPHEAICEDLNLSCTMMRHGYRTHWLNERLSMGLSAEGLPEYITQRTRWCLGTIQVALLK
ncbi:MAG TPA: cellulose synthase catalytic subunit, partial [Methylobacterium sp.]